MLFFIPKNTEQNHLLLKWQTSESISHQWTESEHVGQTRARNLWLAKSKTDCQ